MKLGFEEAQTPYESGSQRAKAWTETWVRDQAFCPSCGHVSLMQFTANRPVADFYCARCSEEYELKSQKANFGNKVGDGAASAMRARLAQDNAQTSKGASSTGRAGRIGSFEPQKDLLTEDQQIVARQFAEQKRPSEQGDQVLVAMHQGEEMLGRQGFNYNEIYTLMWRAGIDPLPKALDVVIQKLMQEQRVERGESGYFLKFLGRARVDKELPGTGKDG